MALQLALVRLIRAWVDIILDQPPAARALLLVLFLATLAMYALGLASTFVAARQTAFPTAAPIIRVVEPAAPEESPAAENTPPPTATPPPAAAAPPPAVAAAAPAADATRPAADRPTRTATPVGSVTPTATLEPTPSQDSVTAPLRPPPETQLEATRAPLATRPPTSTPAPARPAVPAPVAGALRPGGSFAKVEFIYPGDRSVYTVNLQISPDDAGLLKNAGFIVYGPNGEEVVRGGAQPGKRPNVSANVISTRPGRYIVQIQNYDPSRG